MHTGAFMALQMLHALELALAEPAGSDTRARPSAAHAQTSVCKARAACKSRAAGWLAGWLVVTRDVVIERREGGELIGNCESRVTSHVSLRSALATLDHKISQGFNWCSGCVASRQNRMWKGIRTTEEGGFSSCKYSRLRYLYTLAVQLRLPGRRCHMLVRQDIS